MTVFVGAGGVQSPSAATIIIVAVVTATGFVAAALTILQRRIRHRRGTTRARLAEKLAASIPPQTTDATPSAEELNALSTEGLCVIWQHSYHELLRGPDRATIDSLYQLRGRCLAEFDRRDPAGTRQWIRRESRPAAVGPRRHLNPPPTGVP